MKVNSAESTKLKVEHQKEIQKPDLWIKDQFETNENCQFGKKTIVDLEKRQTFSSSLGLDGRLCTLPSLAFHERQQIITH